MQIGKLLPKRKFVHVLPALLLLVFFGFMFSAQPVYAGVIIDNALDIVNGILNGLMQVVGWVLGAIGSLTNYLIAPSPITTSTLVLVGWTITRDFANMLFILILLGIALDFILFNIRNLN